MQLVFRCGARGCVVCSNRRRAFSLTELIVVVSILGILVTLALPRYHAFTARGRMAEAKVNLAHLAALQGIYHAEWRKYATLTLVGGVGKRNNGRTSCPDNPAALKKNPLGFVPDACGELRYLYTYGGAASSFNANAEAKAKDIYPGCNVTDKDKWKVSNTKLAPEHEQNVIEYCN